LESKLGLGPY